MAIGLAAETTKAVDWTQVLDAVAKIRSKIELFPIPAEGGGPSGVGISVPQRSISEVAWEQIVQVGNVLRERFGMELYDLASGEKLTPANAEEVKRAFLGE